MKKRASDDPRPKRSMSVIVIWVTFGLLVLGFAIHYYLNLDNEAAVEGGGRFAVLGFFFLLALIVGTYMEGRSARRKK